MAYIALTTTVECCHVKTTNPRIQLVRVGGVYSGSGCDWLKELLFIGSRGRHDCWEVQSGKAGVVEEIFSSSRAWFRSGVRCSLLLVLRDVCRARLLPFGRVHCGSPDALGKGLVATF